MNPQDPQQQPFVPPTPNPIPQPQPLAVPVPPVAEAPQPTTTPMPVEPVSPFTATPAQPATTMFGSAITSDAATTTTPSYGAPKKLLNKKNIFIIAGIVIVLAIALVVFLAVKPGGGTSILTKATSSIAATVSPASQLAEYKGTSFSISYPKTLKPVDLSKSATAGIESVAYNPTGTTTGTGIFSSVTAIASVFTTGVNSKASQLQAFESAVSTKTPDSATIKDASYIQTTYQGFEAFKSTATSLKDGKEIAKSTALYVFGNKNIYIVSISVATADSSTIGAETDAILASFKITE